MNLEQAYLIAHSFVVAGADVCDRCNLVSTETFGYAGIENLCMGCFIKANLDFDEDGQFAFRLEQAVTVEDLIELCQDYEF